MTSNRHPSLLAVWLTLAVLLSPFLYVLSTGPAAWLNFYICPMGAISWVYWPLEELNNHSSLVKAFFDWYLELWVGAKIPAGPAWR
jgi:hypothetical protein